MKNIFDFFRRKSQKKVRPYYEYPNNSEKTMNAALIQIWEIIQKNPDSLLEIDIQGMGHSIEQYAVKTAEIYKNKLKWKNNLNSNDEVSISEKQSFPVFFSNWIGPTLTPFKDTGEFCFAVYVVNPKI